MTQSSKDKIRQLLAEKKEKSEAVLKEMDPEGSGSSTITIESLYSQLQSLKHEIDIEFIQKKLKAYDQLFNLLNENEDTLLEMINWFKQKNQQER